MGQERSGPLLNHCLYTGKQGERKAPLLSRTEDTKANGQVFPSTGNPFCTTQKMPRCLQNVIALAVHVLYFTHSSMCAGTTLQELGEHESSFTNPEPEFTSLKIMRDSM